MPFTNFVQARKRQKIRLKGAEPPSSATEAMSAAKAAMSFAKSRRYQEEADAPATLRAYEVDYAAYVSWCEQLGFEAVPAQPDIVGAYLASAGEGYSMSTLRRRLAAIARTSRRLGHPLDAKHPAIRETLRGIARKHGQPARQSAALAVEEIKRLCAACDDSLTGVRDRAIFLVCFAGALRRSELVGLDVHHIKETVEGMTLLIPRSKTDKKGEGQSVSLAYGQSKETCPVSALQAWLTLASIRSGPIFRKINRGGNLQSRRLCADAIRQILLKRAKMAGLTGSLLEPISPHGMRAGFVTTAYNNGVRDEEIMEHTRHRNLSTMRRYVRRAKLNTTSAASKIGL